MWNQFLLCCLDCNWGRWVLFDTRKLFLPNAISNVLAHLCFKCTYFRFLGMGELLLQLPLYILSMYYCMVIEQGGIFIVPHLLWHRTSVYTVSPEGPAQFVTLYNKPDVIRTYSFPNPDREQHEYKLKKMQ